LEGGEGESAELVSPAYDEDLRLGSQVAERGLKFLADKMEPSGSFELPENAIHNPTLAIAALGALAFMANGYTADTGPYQRQVRSCVQWILARADLRPLEGDRYPEGSKAAYLSDPGDNDSKMHGHGYATWALAMAYGMSFGEENQHRREELRRVLQAAVHVIEMSQTETGGWGYEPKRGTFHEGSVTITVTQALRAARDAGLRVDPLVVDRAVQYVRNSQITAGPRRGAFRYKLGSNDTSFALTAAAVSTLNQTGIYEGRIIDDAIDYMLRSDPMVSHKPENFPWYRRLYATQAYWQYQDLRYFRTYYPRLVETLANEQSPDDGAFSDREYGEVYATALAILSVSVPFGYLPSFQR
jgi:hypothetical protein